MEKHDRNTQAAETRAELIAIATRLFGAKGFKNVTAEHIVAEAKLTRGALYHHFPKGKPALFEAVALNVTAQTAQRIATAGTVSDWDEVEQIIVAFLLASGDPAYQQIVFQDAPFVLGADRWHEMEHSIFIPPIESAIESLILSEVLRPCQSQPLAVLLFGAACEASRHVAKASDRTKASQMMSHAFNHLIGGLRIRAG